MSHGSAAAPATASSRLARARPARLGVVDRKHLRGVEAHDLEHVLGGPGALVGHDRDVDARAHLRHGAQSFDRLLGIDDIVFLHRGDRAHGLAPGPVALIGVDADLSGAADRLPHRRHHGDVALGLHADLDLDGGDALGDHLRRLARGGVGIHDPDAVRDRGAVADLAAEELIDRDAVDFADCVVERDVDGRLRVRVAAQDTVHARVQLPDLGDVMAGDGGKQDLGDRGRRHLRRFAVAGAMVAAPGPDHLRLAPPHDAAFEFEAENHVAFADARGMTDPVMRPADWQRHQEDLAAADFQAGHAHGSKALPPRPDALSEKLRRRRDLAAQSVGVMT